MIFLYLKEAEYDGKCFRIGSSCITLHSGFYTVEVKDKHGGYNASYTYDEFLPFGILRAIKRNHER